MDALNDESVEYVMLPDEFIPKDVGNSGDNSSTRLDAVWSSLSTARHSDGRMWFPFLFQVAKVVMAIPRSNAEEETIFSMIEKNKTDFRSALNPDTILASLIMTKLALPCSSALKFEPSKDVLLKAEKTTAEYNKEHYRKHKSGG
jgi:hypothetical protein